MSTLWIGTIDKEDSACSFIRQLSYGCPDSTSNATGNIDNDRFGVSSPSGKSRSILTILS